MCRMFLSTVADAEQHHAINKQILNVQNNKDLYINTEKNYKS
jgi:conjugal transfer/entry exclusion protein